MMHDFAISRDRVVFFDLPVVFDLATQPFPFRWDDDTPARVGVSVDGLETGGGGRAGEGRATGAGGWRTAPLMWGRASALLSAARAT